MTAKALRKTSVLFISRAYPPTTGGIEKQNYETYTHLSKYCNVTLLKNPYGKFFIPFFLPSALLYSLLSRKFDIILLGDGVLAAIGYPLKVLRRIPVVSFIHGLDITYEKSIYQAFWVQKFIPKLDGLIVPSRATQQECLDKGISQEKLFFVPHGVSNANNQGGEVDNKPTKDVSRNHSGITILTLGRLVKRKGVEWFIRSVASTLSGNWTYLIAGDGPERDNIETAIRETGLNDRVQLLGKISESDKRAVYQNTDIFVQPNISVPGDIEGFGLVVLEAASYGVPVIATSVDGLRDAITDRKNGFLVEEKNVQEMTSIISALQTDSNYRKQFGLAAQAYCQQNLTWSHSAIEIEKILTEISMRLQK